MTDAIRKPRIALMGEFSAGKSTLSNLLLGERPLPEKVTATRLSPVWLSHGTDTPYREDMNGTQEPVELSQLEGIDVEATRVIRMFFEADILQVCDLIDFPGISDPNMSSDVWQRMLGEVDAVLWCTHATQAWRQSEAAVWDTIPDAVRQRSILLVTRFDKLTTERDQARVLARLGKETEGLFGATFPISLTDALAAGENEDAFEKSGGGAFLRHLIPLIDTLHAQVGQMDQTIYEASMDRAAPETSASAVPETDAGEITEDHHAPQTSAELHYDGEGHATVQVADPEAPVVYVDSSEPVVRVESTEVAAEMQASGTRVVPRRVRPTSLGMSQRPRGRATSNAPVTDGDLEAPRPAHSVDKGQLRSILTADPKEMLQSSRDSDAADAKLASA